MFTCSVLCIHIVMDCIHLKEVASNVISNGLCNPADINVMPNSNDVAASTTVRAAHPRLSRGPVLPACSMEHMPALESKHPVSMTIVLHADGTLLVCSFIDDWHLRFSPVASPGCLLCLGSSRHIWCRWWWHLLICLQLAVSLSVPVLTSLHHQLNG